VGGKQSTKSNTNDNVSGKPYGQGRDFQVPLEKEKGEKKGGKIRGKKKKKSRWLKGLESSRPCGVRLGPNLLWGEGGGIGKGGGRQVGPRVEVPFLRDPPVKFRSVESCPPA